MFKLNGSNEVDRRIMECDYFKFLPSQINTINTAKTQIFINTH